MAARADAAASLSPDRTVFSCFLSCESQCFCTSILKRAYSREFLLDAGRTTFLELNFAHAEELLLQSAAIREETAESPGEDQQTEGQLHSSGCQEAELSPVSPPLLSFTPRTTELWHYDPPQLPTSPGPPPPPLKTVTRTSHFVQHWTDPYLIQHWLQTTSFWQSD